MDTFKPIGIAAKAVVDSSWRFKQANEMERLHPESWRELRQLFRLHGLKALRRALDHIAEQETRDLIREKYLDDARSDDRE